MDLLFASEHDSSEGFPPYTQFEILLFQIATSIKSKGSWWAKVHSDEIWKRWMVEVETAIEARFEEHGIKFTRKLERYLKDSLMWEAEERFKRAGGPFEELIDCVYKSDDVVPEDLRQKLITDVKPLENVPDHKKDWHPGSNQQVLDLVHPSLYPLVYGETLVSPKPFELKDCLDRIGQGTPINPPPLPRKIGGVDDSLHSKRFQWLPTEFTITPEGKVAVDSYINNLHPVHHAKLYETITQVLEKAVPLLDAVLTSTMNHPVDRYVKPEKYHPWKKVKKERFYATDRRFWCKEGDGTEDSDQEDQQEESEESEIEYERESEDSTQSGSESEGGKSGIDDVPWDSGIPDVPWASEDSQMRGTKEGEESEIDDAGQESGDSQISGDANEDGGENPVDSDDESIYQSRKYDHTRFRIFQAPKPATFKPPQYPSRVKLAQHGRLQAIIKLANIELTPENPCYPGGTWHIEGAINENIVASALYYYSSDNISGGHLAFRHATRSPDYEQDDYKGTQLAWGFEEEGPTVQNLGAVDSTEGRLLCFPNLFQHQVQSSITLTDPTRPGSRKLLAIFLVDPFNPIPSTRDVPPQQKEWWQEALAMRDEGDRVSSLPAELKLNIAEHSDWLHDLDWAKKIREELMEERSVKTEQARTSVYEREFSLCEH